MNDEPYRWLEAVANRREYIRDQLKGATPVFAFSRPEGILLVGVGSGNSKVFEIYDRMALAALGHPVDIEKIRQTVIEAAHMEGFTRSPEDVTLRRLLNFSLGPALKTSFEQILSAPIIVECVFAELAASGGRDVLARVGFDGTYRFEDKGVVVVHTNPADEAAAATWLREQLNETTSIAVVRQRALAVWTALTADKPFTPPSATGDGAAPALSDGRVIECALLDRKTQARVRYRLLEPAELS
ncbi:MAG: 20S proteasome subunit A/B [Opitutus sp.]